LNGKLLKRKQSLNDMKKIENKNYYTETDVIQKCCYMHIN
jgi:hypothetical protein